MLLFFCLADGLPFTINSKGIIYFWTETECWHMLYVSSRRAVGILVQHSQRMCLPSRKLLLRETVFNFGTPSRELALKRSVLESGLCSVLKAVLVRNGQMHYIAKTKSSDRDGNKVVYSYTHGQKFLKKKKPCHQFKPFRQRASWNCEKLSSAWKNGAPTPTVELQLNVAKCTRKESCM